MSGDFLPADLVTRMRFAAATLREVSRLYDAFDPNHYPWTPAQLEHEADMVEVPF